MAPEDSAMPVYFERDPVASGGTNTGALMFIQGAEASHCCRVNIYVNNNIQGVTNSVLFGSKVIMRDPRVQLSFRDHRGGRDEGPVSVGTQAGKISSRTNLGFLMLWFVLLGLILFLVLIVWKSRAR